MGGLTSVRAGVREDFTPPKTDGWWGFGSFHLKPLLTLKDIGRDSNVFLDNDNRDPKSAFTATIGPSALGAVQFGERGFLTLKAGADHVWYNGFPNVTHTNYMAGAKGNLNFRKLRFFAAADYKKTKERPSNEFDQRARRKNLVERIGVGFEFSPKTAVDSILSQERISYSDRDFGSQPECRDEITDCPTYTLGDLLDRKEIRETLRLTHSILGRTRIVLDAEARRHEFQSGSPDPSLYPAGLIAVVGSVRDASERRFLAGFEVEPGGLLSGELRAGITDFRPATLVSQTTRSSIGLAHLNWRMGSRVALTTGFERELRFSTYTRNLYYKEDHAELQWILYLNRLLGLEASYDGYRLLYPVVGKPAPPLFGVRRQDEIRKLGVGVRFRLAQKSVAVLRVARRRRTSNIPDASDHQIVVTGGVETTF